MAFLYVLNENVYILHGESIIISNSSDEPTVLKNPELKSPDPGGTTSTKADESENEEPMCVDNEEEEVEEPASKAPQHAGPKGSAKQDPTVICCCLSPCGQYLATADHAKRLIIWQRKGDQTWHLDSTRTTKRKCIKIVLSHSLEVIFAADRAGDVYSFSLSQAQEEGKLLLGHLSMLLDLVISRDDRFIITSDRDEKIRVTHYPSSYNIQSYCLGHTEFVSSLCLCDNKGDFLLSGSGDGTIRLWDYKSGTQLCSHSYIPDIQSVIDKETNDAGCEKEGGRQLVRQRKPAVSQIVCAQDTGYVAVLFDKAPCIGIFHLETTTDVPRLEHRQLLNYTCEPWDIKLSTQRLYVLAPVKDEVLTVFKISGEISQSQFVRAPSLDNGISQKKLANYLNLQWDSLKDCKKPDDFQHLYKQWFDNMKTYLEKKELRKQGKLKKKKNKKFKKGISKIK